MFKVSKLLVISSAIIFTALSTVVLAKEGGSSMNSIQNTQKAVEFFDHELNYKTNPYGTSKVVSGEVKNVTIVDVRTAEDFAKGHIPGAINIPYDKYSNFEGKEKEYPGLRKDGYNYIYCYQLLCNLGQKAAKRFAAAGYPVKEIVGGYKSWEEAGYAIEK